MSMPASTSPIPAQQAPSSVLHSLDLPGLPQEQYNQNPDFTDYCLDVLPQNGLDDWYLTEEFENFLASAQEAEPVGSGFAAVKHPGPSESVQSLLDQHYSNMDESMDDLSDLCFQDLGDFSLSDLNISAAMIDYLLG